MENAISRLEALISLWNAGRAGHAVPTRGDLPISALKPWIGHLALFEFSSQLGPVFRVCGTLLHTRFGGEMTGKPISALAPDMATPLQQQLEKVISEKIPSQARYRAKDAPFASFHDAFLPLRGGAAGDLVLFASYNAEQD